MTESYKVVIIRIARQAGKLVAKVRGVEYECADVGEAVAWARGYNERELEFALGRWAIVTRESASPKRHQAAKSGPKTKRLRTNSVTQYKKKPAPQVYSAKAVRRQKRRSKS